MRQRIVLIDDDVSLSDRTRSFLNQQSYDVTVALDAKSGLTLIRKVKPDLILLDAMLPKPDGFSFCHEIRKETAIPIILLTAQGALYDRIRGLEAGVNDFLAKPFEMQDVKERVQSVLRNTTFNSPLQQVFTFLDLRLDLAKKTAELHGELIEFTHEEFEILTLFVRKERQILTRDQISEHLSAVGCEVFSRSVDIIISRIRQKLRDSNNAPRFFKTVNRTGYVFFARENKKAS